MRAFEYIAPGSLAEALGALEHHESWVRPLAGGTDLLVDMKRGASAPDVVMDLRHISYLSGIEPTEHGLRIGAMVTHTEIERDPLIAQYAPAMIAAAATIGAVQTRNMGTIGGNLVTCVPSMDSGPVLLALDATVVVVGPRGERELALGDFFVGPRRTALAADELLAAIVIPTAMLGRPAAFVKFGLRKGQALALVNAAASVAVAAGRIVDARIALGAVGPTVIRAELAEAAIRNARVDDTDALRRAAREAAGEARPIDDFRASAAYRRRLVEVGTRRVLQNALEQAPAP